MGLLKPKNGQGADSDDDTPIQPKQPDVIQPRRELSEKQKETLARGRARRAQMRAERDAKLKAEQIPETKPEPVAPAPVAPAPVAEPKPKRTYTKRQPTKKPDPPKRQKKQKVIYQDSSDDDSSSEEEIVIVRKSKKNKKTKPTVEIPSQPKQQPIQPTNGFMSQPTPNASQLPTLRFV